jgi:hypothetical protein
MYSLYLYGQSVRTALEWGLMLVSYAIDRSSP